MVQKLFNHFANLGVIGGHFANRILPRNWDSARASPPWQDQLTQPTNTKTFANTEILANTKILANTNALTNTDIFANTNTNVKIPHLPHRHGKSKLALPHQLTQPTNTNMYKYKNKYQ